MLHVGLVWSIYCYILAWFLILVVVHGGLTNLINSLLLLITGWICGAIALFGLVAGWWLRNGMGFVICFLVLNADPITWIIIIFMMAILAVRHHFLSGVDQLYSILLHKINAFFDIWGSTGACLIWSTGSLRHLILLGTTGKNILIFHCFEIDIIWTFVNHRLSRIIWTIVGGMTFSSHIICRLPLTQWIWNCMLSVMVWLLLVNEQVLRDIRRCLLIKLYMIWTWILLVFALSIRYIIWHRMLLHLARCILVLLFIIFKTLVRQLLNLVIIGQHALYRMWGVSLLNVLLILLT